MAAEELNNKNYENMKRQTEMLGLEERLKNKLLADEWRRIKKAEYKARFEKRKLATEAVAKEWKLAAQQDELRLPAEATAKERREEIPAEKRKDKVEAENPKFEREAK